VADTAQASAPLRLDAREAARLCSVCRAHWLRMHSAGRVPAPVRLGRAVRWQTDELREWLAAGCPAAERWQALSEARRRR
jgi:predicted DNA-binding transcriptional regulator AlpA